MKPVNQTKLHSETQNGNCLRACLASILELDIDDMPKFEDSAMGRWWPGLRAWGLFAGYEIETWTLVESPPMGYSIAIGKSPRGIDHACVAMNGRVVTDPHPSAAGLVEIERYITLRPQPEYVKGFAGDRSQVADLALVDHDGRHLICVSAPTAVNGCIEFVTATPEGTSRFKVTIRLEEIAP